MIFATRKKESPTAVASVDFSLIEIYVDRFLGRKYKTNDSINQGRIMGSTTQADGSANHRAVGLDERTSTWPSRTPL
jgi:hypothetical protein